MGDSFYSKKAFRDNLVAYARQYWQLDGSEVDTTSDPLVDLLFGAFASEMERISHRIASVETRVVQRVLELIVPEAANKPAPAFSIVTLKPKFPEGVIDSTTQFSIFPSRLGREFFFTPAGSFRVIDGEVRTICFANKAFQYVTTSNRVPKPVSWPFGSGFSSGVCWLGVRLDPLVNGLNNLHFFVDWPTHPQRQELLKSLYQLSIFYNNERLPFRLGLPDYTNKEKPVEGEVKNESDNISQSDLPPALTRLYERSVQQEVQLHFITLEAEESTQVVPQLYPDEWQQLLPADQLALFNEPLVWLKLQFPPVITPPVLEQLSIHLNAIPVINRRLRAETENLKAFFNVFALELDPGEHFCEIQDVVDDTGRIFRKADDVHSAGSKPAYVLRNGGVARFDERNSLESLQNVLNQIHDEAYSFIAMSGENYNEIVRDLKTINELQRRVASLAKSPAPAEERPHIIIERPAEKPGDGLKDKRLTYRYWTTNGPEANLIGAGEHLTAVNQGNLYDTIQLIQATRGGRDRLPPESQIPLVKKLLLSRNQIVTHADLKTEIMSNWSPYIRNVSVTKQISHMTGERIGLKPELLITMFYSPQNRPTDVLKREIESSVRRSIEDKSSIPINSLFSVAMQWKEADLIQN